LGEQVIREQGVGELGEWAGFSTSHAAYNDRDSQGVRWRDGRKVKVNIRIRYRTCMYTHLLVRIRLLLMALVVMLYI
jgi:hypothetical protein